MSTSRGKLSSQSGYVKGNTVFLKKNYLLYQKTLSLLDEMTIDTYFQTSDDTKINFKIPEESKTLSSRIMEIEVRIVNFKVFLIEVVVSTVDKPGSYFIE